MTVNSPCKDCPNRSLACHDRCEKYKAFKAKLDEGKRRKALDRDWDDVRMESLLRNRRRLRRH